MEPGFLTRISTQLLSCSPNYNSPDGAWTCVSSTKDLKLILALSLVIMLFRVVIYTNLFPVITSGSKMSAKLRIKCHDDLWFFLAHLFTFCCGAYTIMKEDYALAALGSRDAMSLYWRSYPSQHVFIKPETLLFYVVSMSVWLHNLVDLLLERTFGFRYIYYIAKMFQIPASDKCLEVMPSRSTRNDFLPMVLHHIVTSSLLLLSYQNSFTRIGHVTLIISDVSDIFLNITKVFLRMGKKKTSNISFIFFAVSWIYTRHYIYYNTLLSNSFDSVRELVDTCASWDPNGHECSVGITIYLFSVCGFALLQVLFIRWFNLIVKTVYHSMRSELYDALSDEEDSSQNTLTKPLEDTTGAVGLTHSQSKIELSEATLTKDHSHEFISRSPTASPIDVH